jgi:chemosensory pili system protein ChpB (putative protein-glutamate methylesterase)
MSDPIRVVVLGRSGEARAVLRDVLTAAGGEVVFDADPLELSPESLDGQALNALILSLESDSDDEVLDRWESFLERPGLNVVFDEAYTSGRLAGWDQSRWARHLASKVLGLNALLPPMPEDSAGSGRLGFEVASAEARTTKSEVPDASPGADWAGAEAFAGDDQVSDAASAAPDSVEPSIADSNPDIDADASLPMEQDEWASLSDDLADVAATLEAESAESDDDEGADRTAGSVEDMDTPFAALSVDDADAGESSSDDLSDLLASFEAQINGQLGDGRGDQPSLDDLLARAADTDEGEQVDESDDSHAGANDSLRSDDRGEDDRPQAAEDDAVQESSLPDQPEESSVAEERPQFDFSQLSLEPVESEAAESKPDPTPAPLRAPASERDSEPPQAAKPALARPPAVDFARLAAGFGLLPDQPEAEVAPVRPDRAPVESAIGAVVLLAGVGGPDAIRRFLSSLDRRLPVPVLVVQSLAKGNHDRLVPQLAKVSTEPVALAEVGATARSGEVHLLAEHVSAELLAHGGVKFIAEQSDGLVGGLSGLCENLIVVLLSGASVEAADSALAAERNGARVIAQNPEECFDPEGAARAQKQGVRTGSPEHLAFWVKEHWRL